MQALKRKGIPENALEIAISSLTDSSIKQYTSGLKLWWEFCNTKSIAFWSFSVNHILTFLTTLFNKGHSYSSLNTIRSALSLLISPEVGTDLRIKRYFKGIYKLRPSKPKYKVTWNPSIVLTYLSSLGSNRNLSLEHLTLKLAMLLALVTAHRVQTLQLILTQNITITEEGVSIKIPQRIKTSGPNKYQPHLSFPFFHNNPNICTAKTLQDYLEITRELRPLANDNLFITFKKPHKPATSQTISQWIKKVLSASGLDTSIFSAHSTRHAATSKAAQRGISLEVIRNTAGWSASSQVFAEFYNRPLITPDFASAIISPT